MSILLFDCPLPAALPDVSNPTCPVLPGNIQAVVLQRKQVTASFDVTTIAVQATWTPLLAATDATKVVIINAVNFETTPGEQITEGGNDQTTYKGRPKFKGFGYTTGSYTLSGVSSAYAAEVQALGKFSAGAGQRSYLTAYFLTDDNFIISASNFKGIEVVNHFVQDVKKGGGYKLEDNYNVQFIIDALWSFDMVTTHANFNVLDLVNA